MITLSILGAGKVAHHLISTILEKDNVCIKQIYARNPEKVSDLISKDKIVCNVADLQMADVFIVAVSDDAIAKVTSEFALDNPFIVHTSGSAAMDLIQNTNRKGVFYMLQSFSLDKQVDFGAIPFCLEASDQKDFQLIEELALTFSQRVYAISSEQRKSIHLGAVFANNFTNHLYSIAKTILDKKDIPFEILKPLILETAQKVQDLDPKLAQTGPAIRGDKQTLATQESLLEDPLQKQIYQLITKSIIEQ
ncbi:Rossmann-like and DUF2520 domain-containing protein [Myroides sp. LJL115]